MGIPTVAVDVSIPFCAQPAESLEATASLLRSGTEEGIIISPHVEGQFTNCKDKQREG